jgi:hypothetical protein
LSPETIRAARLGWTPGVTIATERGTGWQAVGIVIPWFSAGRLTLVKIRLTDDRRGKYRVAFHDRARHSGIYPGPETVRPGFPLVSVEGEFDSLCLGQDIAELAAVVTLGSASARPDTRTLRLILAASPLYVANDGDQAGAKANDAWPARAGRVRPPGRFKDWTDAKAGGVDLARYWRDVLAGNDRPMVFTWEELTRMPWGPDGRIAEAGIIIDRPDPARRLAAVEAALRANDPEALAERLAMQQESSG